MAVLQKHNPDLEPMCLSRQDSWGFAQSRLQKLAPLVEQEANAQRLWKNTWSDWQTHKSTCLDRGFGLADVGQWHKKITAHDGHSMEQLRSDALLFAPVDLSHLTGVFDY